MGFYFGVHSRIEEVSGREGGKQFGTRFQNCAYGYDYADKCDCSEDDKCGCSFPNNLPHDFGCHHSKVPGDKESAHKYCEETKDSAD